MAIIHSIYRYPVKGLSPEALPRIALAPGETVPGDRLYAIENGPSGFDLSAPAAYVEAAFPDADEERTACRAAQWHGV